MRDEEFISYNKLVNTVVIIGETVLCGGIFLLLYDDMESAEKVKALITTILCYAICAIQTGVVLYQRKVYAFQIMTKALRNVFWFTILEGILLWACGYVNRVSWKEVAFMATLLVAASTYRLTLRWIIKTYRSRGGNIRYVVLVGTSSNNQELYEELTSQSWAGYRVIGYFDHKENPFFTGKCPYLGKPEEAIEYLSRHEKVHYLFCCLPSAERETITKIIDFCENNLVHFYSVPNLHNYLQNRVYFNMLGNVPYLSLRPDPLSRTGNKAIKRAFDILFSTVVLILLVPTVFLVVAIITKITMPGPVFFRQKRNGLNDKEFYCYKFRSMKVNDQADKMQATKDDPRKTKWGNIMRKTNIDELPQFINVLMGDMSVVGPRPHMLKHTEEYSKMINKYMVRHFVKPGITGWSQVTGYRGETKELKDMQGRIRGDIWYIEHWTMWLDVYIIGRTIFNAIKGEKKAY